jgi:hypothetical protein
MCHHNQNLKMRWVPFRTGGSWERWTNLSLGLAREEKYLLTVEQRHKHWKETIKIKNVMWDQHFMTSPIASQTQKKGRYSSSIMYNKFVWMILVTGKSDWGGIHSNVKSFRRKRPYFILDERSKNVPGRVAETSPSLLVTCNLKASHRVRVEFWAVHRGKVTTYQHLHAITNKESV